MWDSLQLSPTTPLRATGQSEVKSPVDMAAVETGSIRELYLDAATVGIGIVESDRVRERWEKPSVLTSMSIGSLAAHLARALITVDHYLSQPVDGGRTIVSASQYLNAVAGLADPTSQINVDVRARADAGATAGYGAVITQARELSTTLRHRLDAEPSDRVVAASGGTSMMLDEYLVTRIVELTVHTDDLCVSIGKLTPELPGLSVTLRTLFETAVNRHGERAVMHAMVRRERDNVDALRVL